jgi:diacylglycerol kinase (ATP)
MSELAVIYNPGSGRRRDRERAVSTMLDTLRRRGLHAEAYRTAGPGDATRLARAALDAGARTIVVHGGDGTMNEAMQPLVRTSVSLALWPGGTANVLARELGLPRGLGEVADMIAAARTRRVSVGRAGDRYFLLMAGVGLDAALVGMVSPPLKRLLGQGAYWVAGLRQLVEWRPRAFLIDVDGRQLPATFAVLAKAASYAGGLRLAPLARLESDVLDLCLFDWGERRQFVRNFLAARSGAHVGRPGVTYVRAQRATVSGDEEILVQVDGDLLGHLPMTFQCVPAALSLVVP